MQEDEVLTDFEQSEIDLLKNLHVRDSDQQLGDFAGAN